MPSRVPIAPKPGAVLGAVKDKPSGRACARPWPPLRATPVLLPQGRDEETAARPNKETARAGPGRQRGL